MRFTIVPVVVAALLALTVVPPAGAHGPVDQANDAQVPGGPLTGWFSVLLAPVGQEFRPSRPLLRAVDLHLDDFTSGDGDTTISVEIHEDTIDGVVVGAATGVLPADFFGWWHFHFDPLVHVEPGRTYVIQVSADENWGIGHSHTAGGPTYPLGEAILAGNEVPTEDLFFRTYGKGKPK